MPEEFDFNKARQLADQYGHLFQTKPRPSESAPQSEWDEHFDSVFKSNRELAALYGVQVNHLGMSQTIEDQRMAERIALYYEKHPEDRFVQIPYSDWGKTIRTVDGPKTEVAKQITDAIASLPEEKLTAFLEAIKSIK